MIKNKRQHTIVRNLILANLLLFINRALITDQIFAYIIIL